MAANPDGSLYSRTTGLILRVEGGRLRLVDAGTGEELLWDEEIEPILTERAARAETRAAQAEERAARETEARRAAEEEIARLRRELEK